jgi:hypothetical protein
MVGLQAQQVGGLLFHMHSAVLQLLSAAAVPVAAGLQLRRCDQFECFFGSRRRRQTVRVRSACTNRSEALKMRCRIRLHSVLNVGVQLGGICCILL